MDDTPRSPVLQLSSFSQNDVGAVNGAALACTVTALWGGSLRTDSAPMDEDVPLPVPADDGVIPASPPSWVLVPSGDPDATGFRLEITCPADPDHPPTRIQIDAAQVRAWARQDPAGGARQISRQIYRQIYRGGRYGVVGVARIGPDGPIYTVIAGVLDPERGGPR